MTQPSFNSSAVARLNQMVRRLYSISSLEAIGNELATDLGGLIAHDSLFFCSLELKTGRSTYYAQNACNHIHVYAPIFQQYHRQFPFVPHYVKHPHDGAVRTYDLVRPAAWRKTELQNEWHAPMGIHEQLGVEIPSGRPDIHGIVLNRRKLGFSQDDASRLNLIRDHISEACAIARQWQRLDLGSSNSAVTSGRRSSIVLDAHARPMLWSSGAERLLSCYGDTGSANRRHLPTRVADWSQREAALHDSSDLWQHPRRGLILTQSSQRLRLRLSSAEDGSCHVLLLEESICTKAYAPAVSKLTPRECEVLEWVSQGKTNEEIASILGASIHTIKTHLKHILASLGVDTRTAAAAVWIRQKPNG